MMKKILLYLPIPVFIGTIGIIVLFASGMMFGWGFICFPIWLIVTCAAIYIWSCLVIYGKCRQWSIKIMLLLTVWIAIGCVMCANFLGEYRAMEFVVSVEVITKEKLVQELLQDIETEKSPWRKSLNSHNYVGTAPEDNDHDSG